MFLHLSCTFTPPAIINGLIVDFNTMKNEQPNADLALDAAVEKAKLEAQEKSPKGFSVGGLVDTFKKDLGDKEMVENKEKEAKEERLHEELKPLVDRLNELSKAFDISVEIDCGRAEYFLLSDNRREYKNLFSQKYKLAGELIKLRDELSKEYSAKGGTKHPLGEAFPELNYVSNVVRADYDFMLKNNLSTTELREHFHKKIWISDPDVLIFRRRTGISKTLLSQHYDFVKNNQSNAFIGDSYANLNKKERANLIKFFNEL